MRKSTQHRNRLRVGILDLDIFGPSIPKLMGLDRSEEPRLTSGQSRSAQAAASLDHRSRRWRPNTFGEPWDAVHVDGLPAAEVRV
jgi:hypothetical protein